MKNQRPSLLIVNETLFSQIQKLFERTYAQVGINLEDCLIDRHRCAQLSILAGQIGPGIERAGPHIFAHARTIDFTSAFIIRAG